MGRRLPSSGDEVLKLREGLTDGFAGVLDEVERVQGAVVFAGRRLQGWDLMRRYCWEEGQRQFYPALAEGESLERESSRLGGKAEVERNTRSDEVVYPNLPELAADESTLPRSSTPREILPASTYRTPGLPETPSDESNQPRLTAGREIPPVSAYPSPGYPELAASESTRRLSSIPPRAIPATRYGPYNRPAHTHSYVYEPEWIDVRNPVTGFIHRELHPRKYATDSDSDTDATTTAAPYRLASPTTRRAPGLPEPAADDTARTLPAEVFAPSTPTTQKVRGIPVEAYPVDEPEFLDVVDPETGFVRRELNPRHAEEVERQTVAAMPAALNPRRRRLEPLRTSELSHEQRRRSLAPSSATTLYSDMSPLTRIRQRSSTTTLPVSPFDTRPSTSEIVCPGSSQQAEEMAESAGSTTQEASRSRFPVSTLERPDYSFGAQSTPLRTTERVTDENQAPVSPTSRNPHTRSSIASIILSRRDYPDLSRLQRTQGPVADASPVERLGSQDIYSAAGMQRDSLRGSTGEVDVRRGRRRGREQGDEGERDQGSKSPRKGEKEVDEEGRVGRVDEEVGG
ncbi:hypothetical protein B0A55_07819 [Friedmanniomyces simplex]|uniref:Uncharacterized protein n=1 Tax=Friedmanniomyces simplex TaxID=329884 RepID=A0A4U0X264_9PEZI|nr:hypothetical protein B0A55_07819 [Friedmanniomyces simplex]